MMHPNTICPHPGKFEGEPLLTQVAYRRTLDSRYDECFGSVQSYGWFCKIDFGAKYGTRYYTEDSSGFFFEISKSYYESAMHLEMKEITVHVSQSDIDGGIAQSYTKCPVALALNRLGYPHARVGTWDLSLGDYTLDTLIYPLPAEVVKFVRDFDGDLPVSPFTFILKETPNG